MPVTSLAHCAVTDGLTLEGYDIPKDATILANIYGVNYNPSIFPDPDTFRLDHFMNKDGQIINSEKLIVFGFGN